VVMVNFYSAFVLPAAAAEHSKALTAARREVAGPSTPSGPNTTKAIAEWAQGSIRMPAREPSPTVVDHIDHIVKVRWN